MLKAWHVSADFMHIITQYSLTALFEQLHDVNSESEQMCRHAHKALAPLPSVAPPGPSTHTDTCCDTSSLRKQHVCQCAGARGQLVCQFLPLGQHICHCQDRGVVGQKGRIGQSIPGIPCSKSSEWAACLAELMASSEVFLQRQCLTTWLVQLLMNTLRGARQAPRNYICFVQTTHGELMDHLIVSLTTRALACLPHPVVVLVFF